MWYEALPSGPLLSSLDEGLMFQMAPPARVLGLNHKNTKKYIKNLFHNHLSQVHEIWYVALPSGPLPSLFKLKSQGSIWPFCLKHRNTQKNTRKSSSEPFASGT